MTSRIRILGIFLVIGGLLFVGAGAFTFVKTQEGVASLKAFSAEQNVKLSYDEQGNLGSPEEAEGIMSLLVDDWKYPVVQSDLDPNDPIVNTATEYMYQMATISYHVLHGTQKVTFAADVEAADGTVIKAGTYEFAVDGRYYADFGRANPIEAAARGQAWSPTALGLIGQLGVGTTTASALQLALALAGLLVGIGLAVIFTGLGLVWVSAARVPVPTESASTAAVIGTPLPAPVAR